MRAPCDCAHGLEPINLLRLLRQLSSPAHWLRIATDCMFADTPFRAVRMLFWMIDRYLAHNARSQCPHKGTRCSYTNEAAFDALHSYKPTLVGVKPFSVCRTAYVARPRDPISVFGTEVHVVHLASVATCSSMVAYVCSMCANSSQHYHNGLYGCQQFSTLSSRHYNKSSPFPGTQALTLRSWWPQGSVLGHEWWDTTANLTARARSLLF